MQEKRGTAAREPLALSLLRKLAEAGGDVEAIDTPAGRLRISSRGKKSAPPLLVLHGLGDSIGGWAQVSLPLLAKFCVHLVDLPGHGLSESPPDWSQETLLAGVKAVVDRFPHARLVGHSLGGWLALKLILRKAISPPSLTLVNPAGASLEESEWEPFKKLILAKDAAGARNYLRRAFHSPPRALELFPGEVLRQMKAPAIASFIGAVKQDDFIPRGALGELKIPTRLIWGASDRLLPPGTLPFWKSELPRAAFALLERAGHCPHLERPFALAKLL